MQMKSNPRILIIPAAGRGVRFQELGKNYPKCVLPVQGTPIIASAVKMLADNTGAFDMVVISCASEEHRVMIEEALAPQDLLTTVQTVVVQVPEGFAPSPAISLGKAIESVIDSKHDLDVTVFLSDMLPADQNTADYIVESMRPDTWAVVEKPAGDFKRWCMVSRERLSDNEQQLAFFDKPKTAPPTKAAACGVYRYSSAFAYLDALDIEMTHVASNEPSDYELQFSQVALTYQERYPLDCVFFQDSYFRDFGTLEEYLANKGVNKCRSFNRIKAGKHTVKKESDLYEKIRDECVWMQNVPLELAHYVPRVVDSELMRGSFTMERIRSSNLRDVALYMDRSYDTWREIFSNVAEYIEATGKTSVYYGNESFWDKMNEKTRSRIETFRGRLGYQANSLVEEFLNQHFQPSIDSLKRFAEEDPAVYYHGDLHFANMFYCFHYKDLKVVDPRGELRGSIYYDLAKLCHSVYGRYDYIDADLYRYDMDGSVFYYDRGHENIENAFNDVIFSKLTEHERYVVLVLTASLFISMIPLHSESPQHCELFKKEFERMLKMAKKLR